MNRKNFYKIFTIFSFVCLYLTLAKTALALTTDYVMLAPFAGLTNIDVQSGLGTYFSLIYKTGVNIAVGLAVVMIAYGGFKWTTTDAINKKEEGKEILTAAVTGLIVVLMSYIVLNTINPVLVNSSVSIPGVNLESLPQGSGGLSIEDSTVGTLPIQNGTFINSLPEGTRESGGEDALYLSVYSSNELGADTGSQERRGRADNLLREGSVALSPDLVEKMNNPKIGSAVYASGHFIGYYEDVTDPEITKTIDIYDSTGSKKDFLKVIPGGLNNLRVEQNEVRQQISNPENK